MNATPSRDDAFRDLRRALTRRRLRGAGARLGVVVAAIAAIVSAFAYWRVRVPLDGLCRSRGAAAAALALAAILASFALAAAALAAERHAAMRRRRPGPEWLALPAEPARIAAHLAAEARLPARVVLPPAVAALLAGLGLLPPLWLLVLAGAFALAWVLATRGAAALVRRIGVPARPAERGLPPDTAWLVAEPRHFADRRVAAAGWRSASPWHALRHLDALATGRATAARSRLVAAAVFGGAGLLVWFDGAEPLLRRAQAFACFLPASAALGSWAIHRACAEPADLHRPLPLSLRDAWRARAVPLGGALFVLAAANALVAAGLPAAARVVLVPAWGLLGFTVAVLGLHYGLTLVPRADAAETVYTAWLGAAITASVMIPLLGWFVLAGGLVHSSLRLRRWWEPEWAR
jgi:hypothetical protein